MPQNNLPQKKVNPGPSYTNYGRMKPPIKPLYPADYHAPPQVQYPEEYREPQIQYNSNYRVKPHQVQYPQDYRNHPQVKQHPDYHNQLQVQYQRIPAQSYMAGFKDKINLEYNQQVLNNHQQVPNNFVPQESSIKNVQRKSIGKSPSGKRKGKNIEKSKKKESKKTIN